MMTALIRFSTQQRWLVLAVAAGLLGLALRQFGLLPVEVLPDLTKPTVTILTEAPGFAPEEVETLVTLPLERSLLGVPGVTQLRSLNEIGLSLILVEFDWSADLTRARQQVQERLSSARDQLPVGLAPGLAPATSLMGNILLVGLTDPSGNLSPRELREIVEARVRPRLQAVPGLAEVLAMGGGLQQMLIEPDPDRLLALGVSFEEVRTAAAETVKNATGGFLTGGSQEIMVRPLAMTTDLATLGETVVAQRDDRAIKLADVARLSWATAPARGEAGVGVRPADLAAGVPVHGHPGVILSLTKAVGFDTLDLTTTVEAALTEIVATLPAGVEVTTLYRQADFIGLAIGNLREALRDGSIMVALCLLVLLLNARVALITLTSIPLSLAGTVLILAAFDLTVNTMTLGGLAVALGLVVDDAIVDVENIHRRLRENAGRAVPRARLAVIVTAAAEVRSSILYATLLILLAFAPLLGLHGVEGRIFAPIAIAAMTCLAVSFVVALTVVPAACAGLLNPAAGVHSDPLLVRGLKRAFAFTCLRPALAWPWFVIAGATALLIGSGWAFQRLESQYLPAFREPTVLLATTAAPGTSLGQTTAYARVLQDRLLGVPEVRKVGYRVGRAERGDHVVPVSTVEFEIAYEQEGERSREEINADLRRVARQVPGTFSVLSSPLADRIGHLLSGVSAPVVVKIHGPDLDELQRLGARALSVARSIPGLESARLEPLASVPQLRIEVDRRRALAFGLTPGALNDQLSRLLGGETVAVLQQGARSYDLVVRLPDAWREDPDLLRRLPLETPNGRLLSLGAVADLHAATGPNLIRREKSSRRLALSAHPSSADLNAVAARWQERILEQIELPAGYHWSFEGEYQARQEATRQLAWLSGGILLLVTLLLYQYFQSVRLVLLVLLNLPLALAGGILLTFALVGTVSIATLVGLIAISGIAARNTIMLVSHYLHLLRHEGESFGLAMVVRGTQERLLPVMLTALSAGLALIPLVLAADAPGKEILHPIAVVIIGGLASSTLLGLAFTPTMFLHFLRRPAERAVARGAPASE